MTKKMFPMTKTSEKSVIYLMNYYIRMDTKVPAKQELLFMEFIILQLQPKNMNVVIKKVHKLNGKELNSSLISSQKKKQLHEFFYLHTYIY